MSHKSVHCMQSISQKEDVRSLGAGTRPSQKFDCLAGVAFSTALAARVYDDRLQSRLYQYREVSGEN